MLARESALERRRWGMGRSEKKRRQGYHRHVCEERQQAEEPKTPGWGSGPEA